MKNILKLLVLVQIVLFTSCKNTVAKTVTPTPPQKVINTDTVAIGELRELRFDTITHLSQPFTLNGISMYWEKQMIMNYVYVKRE